MSDKLDRVVLMTKKIHSSEYLYGVKSCYFANMTYFNALKEKVRLAKELAKSINIAIEQDKFSNQIKEDEEYSDYQLAEKRLNAIWESIDFNQALLGEIKECK